MSEARSPAVQAGDRVDKHSRAAGWGESALPLVARWLHVGRPADPSPALPVGLVLAFNAATSVEQLHRLFGVAIPAEIGPDAAAQSLAELLANTEAGSEVQAGSFGLRAGADQDLLTACCLADAPL